MIVAPSILASKPETRIEECNRLFSYGAKWIHIDIMDGKFVPQSTYGPEVVSALKDGASILYRDVHFMVEGPYEYALPYIESGAENVTFHYEALSSDEERFATIAALKEKGVKVGLSIKPNTKVEVLQPFLSELDLVLVMSVEPGLGGQAFLDSALPKIAYLAKMKQEHGYSYLIEVDGGINETTANLCKEAGVEVLVAGSYLFGKEDQKKRVEGLLQ